MEDGVFRPAGNGPRDPCVTKECKYGVWDGAVGSLFLLVHGGTAL